MRRRSGYVAYLHRRHEAGAFRTGLSAGSVEQAEFHDEGLDGAFMLFRVAVPDRLAQLGADIELGQIAEDALTAVPQGSDQCGFADPSLAHDGRQHALARLRHPPSPPLPTKSSVTSTYQVLRHQRRCPLTRPAGPGCRQDHDARTGVRQEVV